MNRERGDVHPSPRMAHHRMDSAWRFTTRIRGYEVDGSRELPFYQLLHLAEDARMAWEQARKAQLFDGSIRLLARAESAHVDAPIRAYDSVDVQVVVQQAGRTSFETLHRIDRDAEPVAWVRTRYVHVGDDDRPAPLPSRVGSFLSPIDAPAASPLRVDAALEGEVAGEYVAMASDENLGRHVSHAHLARILDDARRDAASRGSLSPAHRAPTGTSSVIFEGEAHAGDALRLRIREDAQGAAFVLAARLEGDNERPIAAARFDLGELAHR